MSPRWARLPSRGPKFGRSANESRDTDWRIDSEQEEPTPPVVIPVVQTWGTKQHLRYAVADTTGRYWTGSEWATRQWNALLYASHHDAAAATRRIL